ncbi:hypothetical protein J6590_104795 [Homalodisca vitripennis]|nr:hypothetical protein J6590_104795 [Homalodisca vitripennis]
MLPSASWPQLHTSPVYWNCFALVPASDVDRLRRNGSLDAKQTKERGESLSAVRWAGRGGVERNEERRPKVSRSCGRAGVRGGLQPRYIRRYLDPSSALLGLPYYPQHLYLLQTRSFSSAIWL